MRPYNRTAGGQIPKSDCTQESAAQAGDPLPPPGEGNHQKATHETLFNSLPAPGAGSSICLLLTANPASPQLASSSAGLSVSWQSVRRAVQRQALADKGRGNVELSRYVVKGLALFVFDCAVGG